MMSQLLHENKCHDVVVVVLYHDKYACIIIYCGGVITKFVLYRTIFNEVTVYNTLLCGIHAPTYTVSSL